MAPVFEDKETNFINKSCERFVAYTKKTDTTSRAFTIDGNYITPLPGTRSEVEKINQLHIDKGSVTKFFIEEDAREERIKQGDLDNFDYIHLATHGFVNGQYPELSGLLLTPRSKIKRRWYFIFGRSPWVKTQCSARNALGLRNGIG
jgi:CHAT domain-containing protein